MTVKRSHSPFSCIESGPVHVDDKSYGVPPKRVRLDKPETQASPSRGVFASLSDELVLRILSYLSCPHLLLGIAPLARRFQCLASDPHLWRALYYSDFVLPRAMCMPEVRASSRSATAERSVVSDQKLLYKGKTMLWVDGRRGGVLREEITRKNGALQGQGKTDDGRTEEDGCENFIDWKRQYKLRHNWARGQCTAEQLRLSSSDDFTRRVRRDDGERLGGMLVKLVDGIAVTADQEHGVRAWDLKSRLLLAHADLQRRAVEKDGDGHDDVVPSCLALDERGLEQGLVDVALGFLDGSFGLWRLRVTARKLEPRYWHEASSNGQLNALALSYPYLLTATESLLISLYAFDSAEAEGEDGGKTASEDEKHGEARTAKTMHLSSLPPHLLTCLRSHTSRPPLSLSIRRLAATTIASIAYTFSTRRGWSIGIQDLLIRNQSGLEIAATRLAFTPSMDAPRSSSHARRGRVGLWPSSTPPRPPRPSSLAADSTFGPEPGPTSISYTYPYLLATLPDNTLLLHLCTSTASSLAVSPGIRLWGHTSGIGDAEITARGRAVSISSKGGEMRVWELEGTGGVFARPGRDAGNLGACGQSVEIRPGRSQPMAAHDLSFAKASLAVEKEKDEMTADYDWDTRRNWVGFDDEMILVSKAGRGGSHSLVVYDFT